MSEFNIELNNGETARLLTAGKFCDKDIIVSAIGGGGSDELAEFINGTTTSIIYNSKKIRAYVCRSLTTLVSIDAPNATSIGEYAFYSCTKLESVNVPKVTNVGSYSFYGCKALKEIVLQSATSVNSNMFYQCSALEKVDIWVASSIGANAFGYCNNLNTIILRRTAGTCSLQSNSLSSLTFTGYIYVPSSLIEKYKTATYWKDYAEQFRAIEDYPDICGIE